MKNKRLAINMIAQSISFAINLGISFFLTRFLVENVGREAYGFFGLANNFVNYAQIVAVALNSMAGRFVTISLCKKDNEKVNNYFTSVIFANVIISVVMTIPSIFIVVFINKIIHVPDNILTDVQLLWAFIFFSFLISIIGSAFGIATFARNRLDLESIRTIESNVIKVITIIILYCLFKPSIWYLGLATAVCTMYLLAVNVYYTKKLLPQVHINKKYFDFGSVKILLSSGIWNSFSKLSSILSTGLGLLITNLFVGASAMGILSVAKTIPTMILSVFAMLASIFSPQLTISYAQNNFNEIRRQLLSSMKLLGMIACIPMAVLFAYGDNFYKLWMPSQNERLLQILSIMSCFELVFALPQESLWNVFTATNKVKQSSIALFCESLLVVTATFLGIIFVKDDTTKLFIIAGTSSAFGTIRSWTFLPMYGAMCLKLKVGTFYPLIIKNTAAIAMLTLISLLIKQNIVINSWISLFFASGMTAIAGLIINSVLILEREDRSRLKNIIIKRFKLLINM